MPWQGFASRRGASRTRARPSARVPRPAPVNGDRPDVKAAVPRPRRMDGRRHPARRWRLPCRPHSGHPEACTKRTARPFRTGAFATDRHGSTAGSPSLRTPTVRGLVAGRTRRGRFLAASQSGLHRQEHADLPDSIHARRPGHGLPLFRLMATDDFPFEERIGVMKPLTRSLALRLCVTLSPGVVVAACGGSVAPPSPTAVPGASAPTKAPLTVQPSPAPVATGLAPIYRTVMGLGADRADGWEASKATGLR